MYNTGTPCYEIPIIPSRYARCLARFLATRGIGQSALLEGTGVDARHLNHPDHQLAMTQALSLFNRARIMLDDELAPFQLGQSLDPVDHGLAGVFALHRHDPERLMGMIIEYLRIRLPLVDMTFCHESGQLTLRFMDKWDLEHLRPFIFKVYAGCIHRLTADICKNMSLYFDFGTRLSSSIWASRIKNASVFFGSSRSQVFMTLPDKSVTGRDGGIPPCLTEACIQERMNCDHTHSLASMVRRIINDDVGRNCTPERVAEQLGMSPRTLRHHLRLSGATFHEIRNEIRQAHATRYLTGTRLPMKRIAKKLGYSDQASLAKAYRLWTGKTPSAVRRDAEEMSKPSGRCSIQKHKKSAPEGA